MSKLQALFLSLTVLVIVGTTIAGILMIQKPQEVSDSKAAPSTTLSIVPSSQTKAISQTFNFSVNMSTGENRVTVFDLYIDFDNNAFEVLSIEQGDDSGNFTAIQNQIDNTNGKVVYSAYTLNTDNALNGSNLEVLVVNARVRSTASAGTSSITFMSQTSVAASGEGQNVLTGTTPGSLVVTGGTTATATPTNPAGTVTVTLTPTGGSTATPTSVNTATPTSINTATPTSGNQSGGDDSDSGSSQATSTITSAQNNGSTLPDSGGNYLFVPILIAGSLLVLFSIFLAL